ncbi:MAG TPA: RagB/SusD family nutrient uptake outer membrane protein [Chitinophaga sp.]|uniref:RagB/SusD family nutrient uptake outer membrane protein n=1 Tax=Chitinophaga sp. TaxID=1869181 RepID=UPI002DBE1793|nr:RagB/SusD family nutrient uptake outer membrane protein [Chitinophaga sp.]HEU4553420.1 RagB/SusD family nutrient uptake outer membrane protein [Chitinophaga sp.]
MRTRIHLFIFSVLLLSAAGCSKVLDKRDLGSLQGDLVFNDSVLARTYLDYIYDQNLPNWGGTWGTSANLSEESYGESKYFQGSLQINDVNDFGTKLDAKSSYGKIRAINLFIQQVDGGTLTDTWKTVLKGQALFFRAWRYFELVKLYGGVPIILEPQSAVGDEAKQEDYVPRNKTSECIAQIVKDLDAAASMLPARWSTTADWGRVTSAAAAALKARALLYWASPEFNPSDLADRWQSAYTAAKAARDLLSSNGYGLNSSFQNMWFSEVNNPEAVFVTCYNNLSGDQTKKNNGYDNSTRPAINGTGGGSNQPSKELVDAFPMKDGKKITDATSAYTYDPQTFYKNRDPRFDYTIAYNGVTWPLNGVNDYKLWTYFVGNTTIESGKASNTGFYCRKAIDPAPTTGNVQYSGTDWMEIRYAEVLLTLAETATGVNNLSEAYDQLKAIRKRAGIDAGADDMYGLKPNMTRAEMFSAILDERLYEFAFEGKRFWDLRRWKLFETVLNGKRRTGVIIKLNTDAISADDFKAQRDKMDLDAAYTNYFTITPKEMDTKYAIGWKPEYYFFPIPKSATDNNPMLIQNIGWGGTFDPVQ